jgi:hypothetical protein
MPVLTLYSNPGCHLCDQASSLLLKCLPETPLKIIPIEGDLALVYQYGVRIPVLKREDSGAELDWPFDRAALLSFIEEEA